MGSGIAGRKLFFLINPKAGQGKEAAWWQAMRGKLDDRGLDYSWAYTLGGKASSDQARRAVIEQKARAVVAVGGDGSLYDVINGLVEKDTLIHPDVVLSACPSGSGCDFAHFLYDGRKKPNLLELLETGIIKPIDIGRCRYVDMNGKPTSSYYINSFDAGAGADTCIAVNAKDGRLKKLLKGKLAFMLSAIRVLMSFSYTSAQIILDDKERISGEYIIMAAGNGRYMGGNMCMFPKAELNDGKLDVFLVCRRNRLAILFLFARVYDGSITKIKDVISRQVHSLQISCAHPIPIELDGEVPGVTDVELSIVPAALPFLFPDSRKA